ncbi:MAG: rhamnan synthesis F family protein [Enterococcus sp.]
MNDLVTVVVTCYNHQDYIDQCLLSIFEQSYSTIELCVINDGSTDSSEEKIKKLLPKSPFEKTTYFSNENQGVCASRNLGIEQAQGEFLLFVDSDNYLDPDYIEKLVTVAQNEQADIVYTDLFDPDKEEYFVHAQTFDFQKMIENNYIDNCSLLRVSKIGNIRYDMKLNRKFMEDYDFLLNLIISNNAKPIYTSETKLNYRVLPESISRKENHESREYFYDVYLYILKKYVNRKSDQVFEAVNTHIMVLENRLADLITHMDEVTAHVKAQEKLIHEQSKMLTEQEEYANTLQTLVNNLSTEKQEILQSASYRLGNKVVRVSKGVVMVIQNPRLLKKVASRVKQAVKIRSKKLPNPKKIILRQIRQQQRKINEYAHPARCLIYVIYEGKPRVQEYKLLFLEALAKLSDNVLIVVNGEIHIEDQERLAQYGEVILRKNEGYDTAAFRQGILTLGKEGLSKWDELLLVNDTNIGPVADLEPMFQKMATKKLDFWGISYGEEQPDITGYNKYNYIPLHLQSYFLVIEKSLMRSPHFLNYWESLTDTNTRMEAIGRHETVFTRHFEDLGYIHGAVTMNNQDSAMYIHPLKMLQEGIPLIKYSAFNNYDDEQFLWQGLTRHSEIPELLLYLENETTYPTSIIQEIIQDFKNKDDSYILIIDGVENIIPQCTRYRVLNKAEQLRSLGYTVRTVNISEFQLLDAQHASLIIIYRYGYNELLSELCNLAKRFNKTVLFDIDDLVIDTKYTDQLAYTQSLTKIEKENYDASVENYKKMLMLCDGVITSTTKLAEELMDYKELVLLNRNLASNELVQLSQECLQVAPINEKIKIGYFSGSITHNENFELVKSAILTIMKENQQVELHLVGHIDLPKEFKSLEQQIVMHPYVEWHELPQLIRLVDINIAPLVDSIFNEAKSEIKWIEAALVKVPTIASNIGAFSEMILENQTGILADDTQWLEKLRELVHSQQHREQIGEAAYCYVRQHCVTNLQQDAFTEYVAQRITK